MSSTINTRDPGTLHSVDRADVVVNLIRQNSSSPDGQTIPGGELLGIAKQFSFNVNKPKTPIYVLSQLNAAGFARDPEDRTFSMTELFAFERIEHIAYFTSSQDPFIIRISFAEKSDMNGNPTAEADQKVMQLDGVEFESVDTAVDANGSEFTFNFTGRFTKGYISGDINAPFDPVTGDLGDLSIIEF